ncbi:hypothetical protein [Fuerstiella marisgermanici]|uniref:Uncharacterized protein n=1 Tax=Fuerstiella marisgermanici TaxID=1891926 RepID=A0A1P8WP81_9PLAN|nr:hypothetical protein [Fuerstiella marisgermanici]APZ95863.1 hypothetical protein Fuma_05526 [Fuerstiella marisgermanici]
MSPNSASVHFLPKAGLPKVDDSAAWQILDTGASMPMMFQLHLRSGEVVSFPYSDLREVRLRDAGFIQLALLGVAHYRISISGRLLTELATLLGLGRVRSLHVADPRDVSRPEEIPTIEEITIEVIADEMV